MASVGVDNRLAYRPAELAAMVGLSPKAIYRAVARGELRAAKVANGSRLLIPADAAEQWLLGDVVGRSGRVAAAGGRRRVSYRGPLSDALSEFEGSEGDG